MDGESQNHRDIHINKYERPERQHIVQPRAVCLLSCQSHDNGQRNSIYHSWDGCLIRCHPLEGIYFFTQVRHRCQHHKESCQHNGVSWPRKCIPHYRTHAQFQHQSCKDKASSNEEAFLKCPGFRPHQISISFPFFFASSIHLGSISCRKRCLFSFSFCMLRPMAA